MDMNDAADKAKRAAYERARGKGYMDPGLRRRFSEQMNGNPFDIPDTPDELELMVGWFFDRLRVIVSIENHHVKFDGVRQIIDILEDASIVEKVNVKFLWVNGQWYISDFETKEDILNLPKVLKRFSRIYRHHALEYSHGDDESVHLLPHGKMGGLTTEEEFKNRSNF